MKEIRKKISVAIGIPAYNEEKNILIMLRSIKNQEEIGYEIKQIIIVSDASTDNTVKLVSQFNDKRIKLIKNKKNIGQTASQNLLMKIANAEVLVFLDADGYLKNKHTLSELIKPFKNLSVGLVGGNPVSTGPNNFLNNCLRTSRRVYTNFRYKLNGGDNVFGCMGGILAMSKSLYKKINIPKKVFTNDAFIYLSCIKFGFNFKNAKNANAIHKFPISLKMHVNRLKRHSKVGYELKEHFGALVDKEFKIPKKLYLFSLLEQFVRHPLHIISIFLINRYARYLDQVETNKLKIISR